MWMFRTQWAIWKHECECTVRLDLNTWLLPGYCLTELDILESTVCVNWPHLDVKDLQILVCITRRPARCKSLSVVFQCVPFLKTRLAFHWFSLCVSFWNFQPQRTQWCFFFKPLTGSELWSGLKDRHSTLNSFNLCLSSRRNLASLPWSMKRAIFLKPQTAPCWRSCTINTLYVKTSLLCLSRRAEHWDAEWGAQRCWLCCASHV